MNRCFVLYCCAFILCWTQGFGQQATTPLEKRNVAGLVLDSLNKPIPGATVKLQSGQDTLQTPTNDFGYYNFTDVRSAEFTLSITALGYDPFHRRYFNNDTKAQLLLPPILLGVMIEDLAEVTIQGLRGPAIKGDTTEFWAADYIVRDYAQLEDLLRRLEGITIDADGTVYYNGEEVVRALFNNEQYFRGSVKEAMRELPANIVERIQIIDRPRGQAGVRTVPGESTEKVMNIVTKPDKAAGRMIDLALHGGTHSRFIADLAQREIDGPHQRRVLLKYGQIPEGLRNQNAPGTLGTDLRSGFQSFGNSLGNPYRGRNQTVTASYGQNLSLPSLRLSPYYDASYHDIWQDTKSVGERFYEEGNLFQNTELHGQRRGHDHRLQSNYRLDLSKKITLSGDIKANYASHKVTQMSARSQRGLVDNLEEDHTEGIGQTFGYQVDLRHRWVHSPALSLTSTLQSTYTHGEDQENLLSEVYATRALLAAPDSVISRDRRHRRWSFHHAINEELRWDAHEQLHIQVSTGVRQTRGLLDIHTLGTHGGRVTPEADWSNYQRQHTIEIPSRVSAAFSMGPGFSITPRLELTPVWLAGTFKAGTPDMDRFDLLWTPSLHIQLNSSVAGRFFLVLRRQQQQPAIEHLNPEVFHLTAFNVQRGDSHLPVSQVSAIDFMHSHYFAKIRLNVSSMTVLAQTDRTVVADRVWALDPYTQSLTTATQFVSTGGGKRISETLGLSQTYGQAKWTLKYDGTLRAEDQPYFLNGLKEWRSILSHSHNLSLQSQLRDWLDLTPVIQYRSDESKSTLQRTPGSIYNHLLYANLKASLFLPFDVRMNVDLSQSLQETTNIMTDSKPFVINANIEKRFFEKKNGILSFVVMDLARQDALTNFHSNEMGYTNTLTNLNSRYYLLQFSWKPQRWTRSRSDTGQGRRGDGSFIN